MLKALKLIEVQNEVNKIFPNLDKLEKETESIYKHLIYNFPSIKIPKFLTLINNVDYQSKIIFADSIILISLDNKIVAFGGFLSLLWSV